MTYSMVTMRASLQRVSGNDPSFAWDPNKGQVHPHLAAQFKFGRRPNFVNDLLEYCWLVYSKALNAAGPLFIGRTGDLWVAEHLAGTGLDLKAKQTLWDPHTKGNIQVMDKWAPAVNDCWVLGGVHRRANFELVSFRTLQNLWDRHAASAHTVEMRSESTVL